MLTLSEPSIDALGIKAEELHSLTNKIQAELLKSAPDLQVIRSVFAQISTMSHRLSLEVL